MIVRFTPRAEADLVAVQDYLERRSPEGARRVAALLQTIEVAAGHPQSGVSTRRPQVFLKIVPFRAEALDCLSLLHSKTPFRHIGRKLKMPLYSPIQTGGRFVR